MLSANEIDRMYLQLQADLASLNGSVARADDAQRDAFHKRIALLNKIMQNLIAYKKG